MTLTAKPAFRKITVNLQVPVVRITLNNPPLNIIDLEMMGELQAALEQAEVISQLSTIVLAGADHVFSAGVDISTHAPESLHVMLGAFHGLIRMLATSRKLTISVVRRHCLGGGAETALVSDLVFATPDSVFGFPEIKLACFPPVACAALAAIVGPKLAAEMILTGRTLNGSEALAAGLVNGISDDPETLVSECVSRVSQLSSAALAIAKKAFYAWDSIHFDKGLVRAEQIYNDELMKTSDAVEGIRAHIEKRRPQWTGK
jgi:cyclohexa-1,5-dienecarbonyl-CoA hydratase